MTTGRPLPGKSEYLGRTRLGANLINLHYFLHCERGAETWLFTFYKPGDAWRLANIKRANTPDDEWQLLKSSRSTTVATPEPERPLFSHVAKTAAEFAKSSPSALDEMLRDWFIEPGTTPKAQGFDESYKAFLPLLVKDNGVSLADGTIYLGATTIGRGMLTLSHLNLRERNFLPVSAICLLREGRWKVATLSLGKDAYNDFVPHISYTRPNSPSAVGKQSPKPALVGLDALEKSCHRFMTRITTGQAKGAASELMAAHKPASDTSGSELANDEAQFLAKQFRPPANIGKPLPNQFEYLAVGNYGPYIARLVYLQRFEAGIAPWVFQFYRPKNEWLLSHVAYPDSEQFDIKQLEVIERP